MSLRRLNLGLSSKRNLVRRLHSMGQVLRFEEDPLLASLCTCLALEFEIGHPDFDRLSPFLGVETPDTWEKEIVARGDEVGLRLRRRDGQALSPRHPDLRHLLDPASVENGVLTQALFFPARIAETYRNRGFNLVIVRDWILNSALCLEDSKRVAYLRSNEWEVRTHIAGTQAPMMTRNELAFFGTHDIVDHLFDSDIRGFEKLRPLHQRVVDCFERTMTGPARQSRPHLLLSYLIGVALDDLAQPRWYGSATHARVIEDCLEALETAQQSFDGYDVPGAFHQIAADMRSELGARPKAAHGALATDLRIHTA